MCDARCELKMAKLKLWEIGVLVLIVVVVYLISLYVKPEEVVEKPKAIIPEGASDEYIVEKAYKAADETACELIEDEAKRNECFGIVEDRVELEQAAEEVRQELGGASSADKKLLGRAMLTNDASLCEQIVDEATKNKCFDTIR